MLFDDVVGESLSIKFRNLAFKSPLRLTRAARSCSDMLVSEEAVLLDLVDEDSVVLGSVLHEAVYL